MKANKDFILREIAGESILLPVGGTAQKMSGLIDLNESGTLLWKRLQEECTERELVEVLLQEYDVDEATAKADVEKFIVRMRENGLIIG
ncbi:MAG: PqqD family protein [Ruminococcaceae bacterium]|nr:PqqD family protein [Oscillospiraceae bacterium]